MKNIFIVVWLIVSGVWLFSYSQKVQASVSTFTLTYAGQPGPLFNETNLAPLDAVTKKIQITNNGDQAEKFALNLNNLLGTNNSKLAKVLKAEVSSGGNVFLSGAYLSDLSDKDIIIQDIPAKQTYTYDIKVTMDDVGNDFQGQETSYDLTFGWWQSGPKGILGESTGPKIEEASLTTTLPQTGSEAPATRAVLSIISFLSLLFILNLLSFLQKKLKIKS